MVVWRDPDFNAFGLKVQTWCPCWSVHILSSYQTLLTDSFAGPNGPTNCYVDAEFSIYSFIWLGPFTSQVRAMNFSILCVLRL